MCSACGPGAGVGLAAAGVVQDGWRLVVVLGMGGIGKTMLAARAAQDVARHFEHVYLRHESARQRLQGHHPAGLSPTFRSLRSRAWPTPPAPKTPHSPC